MFHTFLKGLIIATFVVAGTAAASAQKPSPSPTPDEDVVKISTNLVQVDVTVTDRKGAPVTDLRPDEVQIYENGKLQPISGFSFVPGTRVAATSAEVPKAARTKDDQHLNLPSPPVRAEQVRRTIALVVDDLNLSFSSVAWVQDALRKFVREQMQDGDLVAIIRTGAGIGMLQQFTNDKRQLMAAIDHVKFNLAGNGKASLFDPIHPTLNQDFGVPNSTADKMDAQDLENSQSNEQYRSQIFASGTLGALNFVLRGMRELPGRKSVVLLSEGFSLVTRNGPRQEPSRIMDALQRIIDLANRSSVVFYNIDPRGLQFAMKEAQDDFSNIPGDAADALMQQRMDQLRDSQDGLQYLAKQTGGMAVINQNDISKGIRKVLDDQSYYLVAYVPDESTFDPKKLRYNQLDIRVTRPDARVRFRSGFFSVATKDLRDKEDPTASIIHALTSPFTSSGVAVRMNALFVGQDKDGLTVRAFVNVDPKDITFVKGRDGKYKGTFDFYALTYGDNGNPLDQRYSRAFVVADDAQYAEIKKRGLVSAFDVKIKKPGAYQLRLAIRDKESGRLGSAYQFVEIPDPGKNRLAVSGAVLASQPLGKNAAAHQLPADPMVDTALRQFRRSSVLRYDYFLYNAVLGASQTANVTYKLKLYHEGKVVFEGEPRPLEIAKYDSPTTISAVGTLQLGSDLPLGDYILLAEITDNGASGKNSKVDQFVQFEIID